MDKGYLFWRGDLEPFLDAFLADDLALLPYWPHILDFWELRHEPNVFFTSYERMKRDFEGSFKELCDFLERPVTEDLVEKARDHFSFENMKHLKSNQKKNRLIANVFKRRGEKTYEFDSIRKGKVGSFKEEFPKGYAEKIDNWSDMFLRQAGVTMEEMLNFQAFPK